MSGCLVIPWNDRNAKASGTDNNVHSTLLPNSHPTFAIRGTAAASA